MMRAFLKRQGLVRRVVRHQFVERWRMRRAYWREFNETGEWELRELPAYVPKDRLAIDVGGNIGIYSYHLGRLANDLVTFEPNPAYAELLRRVGLGERLEEVALSDRTGTAELRIPWWRGEQALGMASLETTAVPPAALAQTVEVRVRPLDDYGFTGVGFIKIDVEGHEEGVLRGAQQTLARERPLLLIEIEERHNPGGLERVRAQLSGHTGFFFLNGEKRSLDDFDSRVHQRPEDLETALVQRRCSPYVNNFLFVPVP